MSQKKIYEVIEKELGVSIEKVFHSINPEPIGSASIAQVHEAVLKDGKEVIVKVRRPGIKQQIMLDLTILHNLAKLIEKYIPESKIFDPIGIVEEFSRAITKEIDFRREASNAIVFRENFKDSPNVYIPYVFKEFTTEKNSCYGKSERSQNRRCRIT